MAAGSEGKEISITASKQSGSTNEIDPDTSNDSATIVVTPQIFNIDLSLVKMVQTFSDPVHGSTNPYSIPGAVMRYTILATNFGHGAADADSVIVTDPIPAETDLVVNLSPVISASMAPCRAG